MIKKLCKLTFGIVCAVFVLGGVKTYAATDTIQVESSAGKYTVTASLENVSGIATSDIVSVVFPTWTTADGQDDITWKTGTMSGTTATYTVDFADHDYETGTYTTHAYAVDKSGNRYLIGGTSATITNESPTLSDVQVTMSNGKYTITATVSDDYGIDKVLFPTWTTSNGQDDITWEKGTISGDTVTYTVDFADHNYETGTYTTHIYVYDEAGLKTLQGVSATMSYSTPVIEDVSVTESGGKYKITVQMADGYDLDKALFPTWTTSNGQDDITWGKGTISGNTVTYTVDFSEHNYETGTYTTHIYVYDEAGNYALKGISATITNAAPTMGDVTVTNSGGEYTISVPVSDDYGLDYVLFPTWTTANGQDDITWEKGTISNGVATYTVDFADHNYETGTYTTHIYVYDKSGKYVLKGVSATITNSAPTISNVTISNVTTQGYTVSCTVSDDYGLDYVLFPTWTTYNGQDDITWGKGTISNGVATYTVKISDHDYEYGDYTTHIYVYDKAGLYVVTGKTQTVETGNTTAGWYVSNNIKYLNDSSGALVVGGESLVIDVSHWQVDVDWSTVFTKNSVDAVIARSSYGSSLEDREFADNVAAFEKLGVSYGVYHYSTATTVAEAKEQAYFMLEVMEAAGADPDLPVYIDIEDNGGSAPLISIAKAFCAIIEANGYTAGIYANENYWNNYLDSSGLDSYEKWIANYGTNNGYAKADWRPDDEYGMWQYTSVGSITGIDGNVDMNVMFK